MGFRTRPTVQLDQPAKGASSTTSPSRRQPQQVLRSTDTEDLQTATRIAEETHRFMKNPRQWECVPDTFTPMYSLLDVIPGEQAVKELLEIVLHGRRRKLIC